MQDLEAKYKAPIPQNYVRSAIFAPFMEAAKELNVTLQKDEKALLSQLNALEKQVSNVLLTMVKLLMPTILTATLQRNLA